METETENEVDSTQLNQSEDVQEVDVDGVPGTSGRQMNDGHE
jgi:hypothetical protein